MDWGGVGKVRVEQGCERMRGPDAGDACDVAMFGGICLVAEVAEGSSSLHLLLVSFAHFYDWHLLAFSIFHGLQ